MVGGQHKAYSWVVEDNEFGVYWHLFFTDPNGKQQRINGGQQDSPTNVLQAVGDAILGHKSIQRRENAVYLPKDPFRQFKGREVRDI